MADPRTNPPTPDTDQDEDPSEQAAWEIATAETLRARGELADAASWYRRAANHLMEAGDDERAIEVAKLAAELVALESAVRPPSQRGSAAAPPQAHPPPMPSIAPAPATPSAGVTQSPPAKAASVFPSGARPLSQAPSTAHTPGAAPGLGAAQAPRTTGQIASPAKVGPAPTTANANNAYQSQAMGPPPAPGSAAAKIFGGVPAAGAPRTATGATASPASPANPAGSPTLGRPNSVAPSPIKLTGSTTAPRPAGSAGSAPSLGSPSSMPRPASSAPTAGGAIASAANASSVANTAKSLAVSAQVKTTGSHRPPTTGQVAPTGLLLPSAPIKLPAAPTSDENGETSVISLPMIASPIASMLDEAVATMPRENPSFAPSATKRPLSFRPERAAEGESIAARLSALPLFSDLPTDRLRMVSRQLIVESRKADETLCESGAPEGPLYVILSGTAWVGLAGKASPVALASAGDVVGEIAALFGGPRTATIIAREPMETVAVAPSLVRSIAREFPSFRESLLESITERMQESLPEIAPCLRRLSDDARRDLMDLAEFVEVAEGDELLVEGEPSPSLFVVAAGEAECFGGELGVRHAIRVRVGEMMGAASVLGTAPAGVTARASRALLVAKMEAKAVQKLLPLHHSLRELLEDVANPGKGVVC